MEGLGMGDMFSGLREDTARNPSPIILPDIRYQFSPQIDPATGEVQVIFLQIWLTSLPLIQIAIPFDRLSFAHFAKAAREAGERGNPVSNGSDD